MADSLTATYKQYLKDGYYLRKGSGGREKYLKFPGSQTGGEGRVISSQA